MSAWLDDAAVAALRAAIREAGGSEVFCTGTLAADGLVRELTVAARGNQSAVPVLAPYVDGADVLIHNHPSGLLQPSEADLEVASYVGNQGKGFLIVDNQVTRIYVVTEPVPVRAAKLLDTRALAATLQPDGPLQRLHSGYEQRPGQVAMLQAVCDAFNDEAIVVAEAGTGIGKSLAYLIPAVSWAHANDERVVVSTATINLQQQLMEKDLPLVQRVLGTEVRTCLVKGRSHYLCRRRLQSAQTEAAGAADGAGTGGTAGLAGAAGPAGAAAALDLELLAEEGTPAVADAGELRALQEWAEATPTGNRSDLPFAVSAAAWERVCSEADACGSLRCPDRERCFVLRARREAAAARVLVVNHHLLFADLALRQAAGGRAPAALDSAAVLPGFRRLVFDEAHAIENSALSFFSSRLSAVTLERIAGRLLGRRRGVGSGLIGRRAQWFTAAAQPVGELVAWVADLRRLGVQLEAAALDRLDGEQAVALAGPGAELLRELLAAVERTLLQLSGAVAAVVDLLEAADQELADAVELRVEVRRMRATVQLCQALHDPSDRELVRWVEARRRQRGAATAVLVATPVDIAPLMRAAVFARYPSVVLTSATLTVADRFAFWCGRVGLGESSVADGSQGESDLGARGWGDSGGGPGDSGGGPGDSGGGPGDSGGGGGGRAVFPERYPSPFDWQEQVLVGVPTDAPDPTSPGHQRWLGDYLTRVLQASRGRALVLFTAYGMLQRTYRQVQGPLARAGIHLLRQGDHDRHLLLTRFQEDTASVLFATDSFWEGVDTPGEALSLVVICRLPFGVPTHPVTVAQMERVAAAGEDPFTALALPRAAMRVRQGFGRLIRRRDDRGVVLILDPRVARKAYGEVFLRSLPDVPIQRTPAADLLDQVAAYFAER